MFWEVVPGIAGLQPLKNSMSMGLELVESAFAGVRGKDHLGRSKGSQLCQCEMSTRFALFVIQRLVNIAHEVVRNEGWADGARTYNECSSRFALRLIAQQHKDTYIGTM